MGKITNYFLTSILLSFSFLWISCNENENSELEWNETNLSEEKEITDSVEVNSFEIQRVISGYLKENGRPQARANEISISTIGTKEEETLYVVNFLPNNGFLVLSSSKNCYPILAHSEKGRFDIENIEGGLSDWKDKAFEAMSYLNSHQSDSTAIKARSLWQRYENHDITETLKSDIEKLKSKSRGDNMSMPTDEEMKVLVKLYSDSVNHWNFLPDARVFTLDEFEMRHSEYAEEIDNWAKSIIYYEYQGAYKELTFVVERSIAEPCSIGLLFDAQWGQTGGRKNSNSVAFNEYCPLIDSIRAKAGCGPVAIGQLMYYHKWPQKYNWSAMEPYFATQESAKLLLDIALMADVTFGKDATGISEKGIADALTGNGYSNNYISTSSLESYVRSNIKDGLPVIMLSDVERNDGKGGYHAWIISGYQYYENYSTTEIWTFPDYRTFSMMYSNAEYTSSREGYFCNWGWNGTSNGWYVDFDKIIPWGFVKNNMYGMFFNIRPIK